MQPKENSGAVDFTAVKLGVASAEEILRWSYGEVLKPETINYRTQKPERDGLFCERIFGPIKDYECTCGKYRKIRYRGVICDKCGVEVTKSSVRRERMGHIDLAAPVAHVWYIQGVPSTLGTILDVSVSDLEKVVYFAAFIIKSVNEGIRRQAVENLDREFQEYKDQVLGKTKKGDASDDVMVKLNEIEGQYRLEKSLLDSLAPVKIISEQRYHELSLKYGQIIDVGIGSDAILELLKEVDISERITTLGTLVADASPVAKRKLMKRIKLFTDLKRAKIKPEWMVLIRLPVIPPDLRPMVQLDGGRFAASDLNDLYRRVLNRNNRLKKLLNQGAPEVITRNEKRMLQEAVDALIDNNARRGKVAASTNGKRRLKSLSDMLRGKQGRFRQNLLGKRVDYSGRSVIVIGPSLRLNECGIPKIMAIELFKPMVISRLIRDGHAHNVKQATRLIEQGEDFVWDILEEITNKHHVLLNRAPTLHRLGIQAFKPVLVDGKAIQVHPNVCQAFNADFDGDQMAVHVPLSEQAQKEAAEIMLSSKNLLKPASGDPISGPRLDMTLGIYYLTGEDEGAKGEGKIFYSPKEAIRAFNEHAVDLRAKVKVQYPREDHQELVETTIGRVIFNESIPVELRFVNEELDKKKLNSFFSDSFNKLGIDTTALLVDIIKDLGFKYAEYSGITFAIADIVHPDEREAIIDATELQLAQVDLQFRRGLITENERYLKTVELWFDAQSQIEKALISKLSGKNPVVQIFKSGARGSLSQMQQISGMKGLVANPSGRIIEIPIKNNFKDGLSVFEYFVSTHGARKGRADTALRTSDAGYLTRRLVDVAQDVVISEVDCGTKNGIKLHKQDFVELGESFTTALVGRYLAEKTSGVKVGEKIGVHNATKIAEENDSVTVRSPLRCTTRWGICQTCYGEDLAVGNDVRMGEAVGIIAAQAIGEPGTQLTMRTFHTGGVASSGGDITTGLPRVEELFEARSPKGAATLATMSGTVNIETVANGKKVTIASMIDASDTVQLEKGLTWFVNDGDKVRTDQPLAKSEKGQVQKAPYAGVVSIKDKKLTINGQKASVQEEVFDNTIQILVKEGEMVGSGDPLTEGNLDLKQTLDLKDRQTVENYIINEIQKIYTAQGQPINNKHIEILVRKMLCKGQITDPGTSKYIEGELIDILEQLDEIEKYNIKYTEILLGISRVSLNTSSFLSAASFQETTNVLMQAAIRGQTDHLKGLKENVIIGKLIPAGTGYKKR
ncbi:MAG: DNA-directed RNA polymerase subunit beta' [bacterium]|nr:DNA-directed RNA polymerase subunit beta' [bacterium]